MTCDSRGPGALDHEPCRYGRSKLTFRGPKRVLDRPYMAFLGGCETFGRFMRSPYPALVEAGSGKTCVNLGLANAGIDAYLNDGPVMEILDRADLTIVELLGARNLNNRFYQVHTRRNDRFIAASEALRALYPKVDFSEFHFTGHLLDHLYRTCPERFATLKADLQRAWLRAMRLLLGRIGSRCMLLGLAEPAPRYHAGIASVSRRQTPAFVTREMIAQIAPLADGLVEVIVPPRAAGAADDDMAFSEMEAPAAARMLGGAAHREVAAQILARVSAKV
ncbi:DUF6473 family protein [Sulfitobacter aestuarii]|uniref:DUF6473 family protein n=1 Tax=Sulfitobacter aestuarii TaxID=2161676 RepID=A0ABW5TWW7_9RHOB